MRYIDLTLIQVIIVFIIDLSGVIPQIKHLISKILTNGKIVTDDYSLKPIDCSLCTDFWVGLILILIYGGGLPMFAYNCCLAFLTPVTSTLLITIKEIFIYILNKVLNLLK